MLRCSPGASSQRGRSLLVRVSDLFAFAILVSLVTATPAFAQAKDQPKHWGVGFSFTPQWTANTLFQELLLKGEDPPVEGDEFSFGVVRGSVLGGDWSVSYVRQRIKDGFTSTITESETGADYSYSSTSTFTYEGVYFDGVEVNVFVPVKTFKNRVQVGFSVGGGVGFPRGTIHEVVDSTNTFPGFNGQPITTTNHDEFTDPAEDVLLPIQPLGKVEAMGAFIVAPGLKVKVSFGMSMPSATAFRIGAVYLISAR